jgi:5-hydroxyisourate hydrolase
MSRLSTHVLDTYHGIPASGVKIELFCEGKLITQALTNKDGRTDAPLMLDETFKIGVYTLMFHIGDYFKNKGVAMPFLNIVPVTVTLQDGHYHVPLVCSPFSYSTYRGS